MSTQLDRRRSFSLLSLNSHASARVPTAPVAMGPTCQPASKDRINKWIASVPSGNPHSPEFAGNDVGKTTPGAGCPFREHLRADMPRCSSKGLLDGSKYIIHLHACGAPPRHQSAQYGAIVCTSVLLTRRNLLLLQFSYLPNRCRSIALR